MSRPLLPLAVAALGLAAAGCGASVSQPTGEATTRALPHGYVIVKHMAFTPQNLTVRAGDTVTWVWEDGLVPHNVTFQGFASSIQSSGTWKHTFDTPGTYSYRCTLHYNMVGTVVVQPS